MTRYCHFAPVISYYERLCVESSTLVMTLNCHFAPVISYYERLCVESSTLVMTLSTVTLLPLSVTMNGCV